MSGGRAGTGCGGRSREAPTTLARRRAPGRPRASLHVRMRWCWPTAATACRVARSVGRGRSGASRVHPAAIAPEVTMTTRSPASRAPATSPASLSTAATSRCPSVVTEDDPILTTRVRAEPSPAPSDPLPPTRLPPSLRDSPWGHRDRRDRPAADACGSSLDQTRLTSPMWTTAPSRAPARTRARSTPSRRNRACT